jgi:hypothetical protein
MEMLTDLDSHANQFVLGNNTSAVYDYEKPVNIVGYDPKGPVSKEFRTIMGALAYDCPNTGETFILIVNQAIHNPKLAHNFLSLIQMWLYDVEVNDKPKLLTDKPTECDHAICVVNHETNEELVIPLTIIGGTSTFPTRKLTQDEYNTCTKFELNYDSPEYEPSNDWYATSHGRPSIAFNRSSSENRGLDTHTHTHTFCIPPQSRQDWQTILKPQPECKSTSNFLANKVFEVCAFKDSFRFL